MYKIPDFTEMDSEKVLQFMKQHAFVVLTGNNGLESVATQVPVLVEEHNGQIILRGHIMRNTDHFEAFAANNKVLVLFMGPHCYVSSSWYKERNIGSTWNYMTVHVRGLIHFSDEAGTVQLLIDLTNKFEGGENPKELVENMPAEYVNTMVKAIAGFTIEVKELYPIFKLSQNRSDESYKNIISHLEKQNDSGAEDIAGEMMNRRPHLFDY